MMVPGTTSSARMAWPAVGETVSRSPAWIAPNPARGYPGRRAQEVSETLWTRVRGQREPSRRSTVRHGAAELVESALEVRFELGADGTRVGLLLDLERAFVVA